MKIKVGDIVAFKDNGDFSGHVIQTNINANRDIVIQYHDEYDDQLTVSASLCEVVIVCSVKDSSKIQLASLDAFASALGYIRIASDNHNYHHPDMFRGCGCKSDNPKITFNKMVSMHNGKCHKVWAIYGKSKKLVDRVKMQYSKQSGEFKVQSHWIHLV